jgi:hypothetical protein
MAIIGSLFALAGRFLGRLVNALLGWATILLFGRVESRKQTILGFVVMASLAWVGALVGVLLPDVGAILVAAIPRPDFIDESLVRLGMVVAVLAIPLGIGVVGLWMTETQARPRGLGLVRGVLRGYPFTALLAFLMAFLAAVAFVRKVNSLRRRWQDAHIPVIVKPTCYDDVVAELANVLRQAQVEVAVREAPRILTVPPRLLERAAGRALGGMVPDHLMLLANPKLEILVYPSDVALSGEKRTLARARAAIASRLTQAPAWLTTSAEGQDIENRLDAIRRALMQEGSPQRRAAGASLTDIDRRLAVVAIPFDEWETLYRMRLQIERDALQGREHVVGDAVSRGTEDVGLHGAAARRDDPGASHRPLPAPEAESAWS